MECPICLDPIVLEEDFVEYCKDCRKVFHRHCLPGSCPMCRVEWNEEHKPEEIVEALDPFESLHARDQSFKVIMIVGRVHSGKSQLRRRQLEELIKTNSMEAHPYLQMLLSYQSCLTPSAR